MLECIHDVLFADRIRKYILSRFTEQILRHEKISIQSTENVKPPCNISNDDESKDEDGSRDGDDNWPIESQDDLHEQAPEWEAWAQGLVSKAKYVIIDSNGRAVRNLNASNLQ